VAWFERSIEKELVMSEYVGLDVSKEQTSYCVKDKAGGTLTEGKVATSPDAIFEMLKAETLCPERVVLETGSMSGWLHRHLSALSIPVICVDARQAHAVMKLQPNKTDANDAAVLAELARTGFYRPVALKSESAQERRSLLKARDQLVRHRRDIDNTLRGLLRSFGIRLPKGVGGFVGRVRTQITEHPTLTIIAEPLLAVRDTLDHSLDKLDREVGTRVKADPICRRLMSVPGVGPVTALCFVSTIDDPTRFTKSRTVGAYLGLTSRRYQSGEMDYSGRISKRGDRLLRTYLYEAAHCLLTSVRRACALKSWARRIQKRAGQRKACVALARKLAVLLHRLWQTGATFHWPRTKEATM
jgi:transposase